MFGLTIGLYKGEPVKDFESGKKYLIKVMRRPGYYIIKEVQGGQEYIYIDSGRVLENWELDKNLL